MARAIPLAPKEYSHTAEDFNLSLTLVEALSGELPGFSQITKAEDPILSETTWSLVLFRPGRHDFVESGIGILLLCEFKRIARAVC